MRELKNVATTANTYLPPVRAIAGRLGVTQVTVLKALRQLVAAGVLKQDPRNGRYFSPATHTSAPLKSARQAVSAELKQWVFSGRFDHDGRLPPVTTIARTLGRSRDTVRQAIGHLIALGLLYRSGRQVLVRTRMRKRTGSRVVLSARLIHEGEGGPLDACHIGWRLVHHPVERIEADRLRRGENAGEEMTVTIAVLPLVSSGVAGLRQMPLTTLRKLSVNTCAEKNNEKK